VVLCVLRGLTFFNNKFLCGSFFNRQSSTCPELVYTELVYTELVEVSKCRRIVIRQSLGSLHADCCRLRMPSPRIRHRRMRGLINSENSNSVFCVLYSVFWPSPSGIALSCYFSKFQKSLTAFSKRGYIFSLPKKHHFFDKIPHTRPI